MGEPIHAVIGVRTQGGQTYYVKRSQEMTTYKGVWSLLSEKFDPVIRPKRPPSLGFAEALFGRMSHNRLGGIPITALRYLTSGSSDQNPMQTVVTLHLFEVALGSEPTLHPRYYTDARWMTPEEYEIATVNQQCGLCTRLWARYLATQPGGMR